MRFLRWKMVTKVRDEESWMAGIRPAITPPGTCAEDSKGVGERPEGSMSVVGKWREENASATMWRLKRP
jgi:hypothetical protein